MPTTMMATIIAIAAYITYDAVLSGCASGVVVVGALYSVAVKCASAQEP